MLGGKGWPYFRTSAPNTSNASHSMGMDKRIFFSESEPYVLCRYVKTHMLMETFYYFSTVRDIYKVDARNYKLTALDWKWLHNLGQKLPTQLTLVADCVATGPIHFGSPGIWTITLPFCKKTEEKLFQV